MGGADHLWAVGSDHDIFLDPHLHHAATLGDVDVGSRLHREDLPRLDEVLHRGAVAFLPGGAEDGTHLVSGEADGVPGGVGVFLVTPRNDGTSCGFVYVPPPSAGLQRGDPGLARAEGHLVELPYGLGRPVLARLQDVGGALDVGAVAVEEAAEVHSEQVSGLDDPFGGVSVASAGSHHHDAEGHGGPFRLDESAEVLADIDLPGRPGPDDLRGEGGGHGPVGEVHRAPEGLDLLGQLPASVRDDQLFGRDQARGEGLSEQLLEVEPHSVSEAVGHVHVPGDVHGDAIRREAFELGPQVRGDALLLVSADLRVDATRLDGRSVVARHEGGALELLPLPDEEPGATSHDSVETDVLAEGVRGAFASVDEPRVHVVAGHAVAEERLDALPPHRLPIERSSHALNNPRSPPISCCVKPPLWRRSCGASSRLRGHRRVPGPLLRWRAPECRRA